MNKCDNCLRLQESHPNRCCGCFYRVEWANGAIGLKGSDPHIVLNLELYMFCQVLEKGRWITKSRGLPSLARMHNFQVIMESADTCRVRKRLPNGNWFGACMALDHLAFVKAAVKYLEDCNKHKIKPIAHFSSFHRDSPVSKQEANNGEK